MYFDTKSRQEVTNSKKLNISSFEGIWWSNFLPVISLVLKTAHQIGEAPLWQF